MASDGPVPWSSSSSVSFVAEQVSHHPPSEFQTFFFIAFAAKMFEQKTFVSHEAACLILFLFLIFAVSAFYAECLNKKIQFNAHIWTKSKFLGMSIGVHNIGQGKTDTFSNTIYFFPHCI